MVEGMPCVAFGCIIAKTLTKGGIIGKSCFDFEAIVESFGVKSIVCCSISLEASAWLMIQYRGWLQAATEWWNTNGVGNAGVHLCVVLPRLESQSFNAHSPCALWCHLQCLAQPLPICDWISAPLHVTGIAVCTTDLQILHSHNKHAGTPLGTPVFVLLLFHNHLLVFWSNIV